VNVVRLDSQTDVAIRLNDYKMARRSSALAVLALLSRCCYCRAAVSNDLSPLSLDRFYGQNQVDDTDNSDNSNIDVFNQFHLHESSEWPFPNKIDNSIGQISGVSISKDNLVYIFHRGNREWNQSTFLENDVYRDRSQGPISGHAVVILDPRNGSVIKRWGSHRFYMPHGITVDHENNVWLTDVALHQVFKFGPSLESSSENLLMTLGTAFEPGNDLNKFCKPTSVAVTTNGEFYIADGYCNSRIVKFSAEGRILLEWGRSTKVSG